LEKFKKHKDLILEFIKNDGYIAMKPSEIMFLLDVPAKDKAEFSEIIKVLEREGEIIITKKGKIMPLEDFNIVKGVFLGHAKGFGFIRGDGGRENDIFIPANKTNTATHKDIVLVKITSKKDVNYSAEGEIIKIIERGISNIVGIFESTLKGSGFVIPRETKIAQDIFIAKENTLKAVQGHVVVVKIIKAGNVERNLNPEGKIIEILGHINEPGVDILSVIKQFELPLVFSEKVIEEVRMLDFNITDEEIAKREDLRSLTMITIDGEDSKDLDDAVSLEIVGDIYRLGVHIADVSHYVSENSELDKEAFKRSTSVYLVDRVIPMLPHELSNGICSLNAGVDRLSLSCIMDIDKSGNVVAHKIIESIINVDKRTSYNGVNEALLGNEPYATEYKEFAEMLNNMNELRDILRTKRIKRGAIEFGFAEAKIILDADGVPVDIISAKRSVSSGIIEEFMLICNETVAEEYFWQELPFVYRSHEEPDREKIDILSEFVRKFGYHMKGKQTHSKSIQKLVQEFEGTDEEAVISRASLRSLKQARYTHECDGHFGLAAKYYCHFTSPIRRYPDLMIHRIIKANINGKLSDEEIQRFNINMPDMCKHTSLCERRAEDAEREVDNMKKIQFMEDKIGWEFEGFISSVTNWGIYVELPNTVEGMVSLSDMNDDYYVYDNKNYRVIGERTKKIYELGQKVRVKLVRASVGSMKIDFVFI